MNDAPVLAVIGGTGLTQFSGLENVQTIDVDTPFGKPSSPITLGILAGKQVAFLARHGIGHHILPSELNNRANIYAFKSLGITRLVGISACGSLRDDYAPGHVVIPDQLIDFTKGRQRTFFGEGIVAHIGSADPFCSELSNMAYEAVSQSEVTVHMGGTLVTIEGPRFSTRAESNLFRSWGLSIIGMTTSPEAFLAREAEICYTTVAHVTDYDVWHTTEEAVNVEMIIRTLNHNTEIIQQSILFLVESLPIQRHCGCDSILEKAIITNPGRIPRETRKKLGLLLDKYLPE